MDFFVINGYAMLLLLLYYSMKAIKFLCSFMRCYILPNFGFVADLKTFGKWAVITGATDGIGRSYAVELAKRGLNIVLISRTKEKLETVAKELTEKYGVDTKIVVFDFTGINGYNSVRDMVGSLDIGILVNNVGMTGRIGTFFDRIDAKNIMDTACANMFGEIEMTHMVLTGMVERQRGVVVHVSSSFSYFPIGMMNVYPATKMFINTFVSGLQMENEKLQNVRHQLVTPFFVSTNMTEMSPSFLVPAAEAYAKSAVNTIGLTDHTCGYWVHCLLGLIVGVFSLETVEKLFFPGLRNKRLSKRIQN